MDTTPGQVKACTTNMHPPLNDDECEKLRKEGWCFWCKKQGHLSRNCPDKPSQVQGNPEEEDSNEEAIQATSSKMPTPKPTNPFLVKKKTTAQHIICLITDAEDNVKDTIIQEVFMKQDFWNAWTRQSGEELFMRYVANLCTIRAFAVWKYQFLSTPLTQWPRKKSLWTQEPLIASLILS